MIWSSLLLALLAVQSQAGSQLPSWAQSRAAQYSSLDQDSIRIMSFNVQNYFNGRYSKGRVSFQQGRGPRDQSSYQRKKSELARFIRQVKPDILALQEVENDTRFPRPAILDLAKALDDKDDYKLVSFSSATARPYGTDAITQFILFKPSASLTAVGAAKSLSWSHAKVGRPLILQKFQVDFNGQRSVFCVANSHLKSRRNNCGGDRNCTQKRLKQAKAFSKALLKQRSHCESILWVGDFNAEPHHQTLKHLRSAQWQPLLKADEYSYVFRGQKNLLDHALWLGPQPFLPITQVIHQSHTSSDHAPVIVDLVVRSP